MKRTFIKSFLFAFVVYISAFLSVQARADEQDLPYSVSFTDDELDNLLAPIALYPDPLLAQMLPASTYPGEVADAEAWLRSGGYVSSIDEQPWAESVRAIAHYPNILQMMADNMDWTANLGDAFLNQPEDVTNSIQRLRWRARSVGNLASNSEQSVIVDGDYIQIVPAQPQYVYVPQYDSSVVYVQAPAYSPFITFGFGLAIGGWLSMDFDWGHHDVIYHGWDRPGWVDHARPYVHVTNVYVNRSRPDIHQTWRHDRSHGDPARYLASRPSGPNAGRYARVGEARGTVTVQSRPGGGMWGHDGDARAYSNRGRESRGIGDRLPPPPVSSFSERQRTMPPPPPIKLSPGFSERRLPPQNIGERPPMPVPGGQQPTPVAPSVRGAGSHEPGPARASQQPVRTPSVTFGGYRGGDEARALSARGQESLQKTERPHVFSPPIRRDSAPEGKDKDSSGDRQRR